MWCVSRRHSVSGGALYELVQVPAADGQLPQHASLPLQQLERRSGLRHGTGVHDDDPVVVHHGVEAMRDGDDRALGEMGPDDLRPRRRR